MIDDRVNGIIIFLYFIKIKFFLLKKMKKIERTFFKKKTSILLSITVINTLFFHI